MEEVHTSTPEVTPQNLDACFAAVATSAPSDVIMDRSMPVFELQPVPSPRPIELQPTMPDALLQLTAKPLTSLQPPLVTDAVLCDSLTSQAITVQDRCTILDHQETVWGDDELRWHLGRISIAVSGPRVTILDPLLAIGWMQQRDQTAVLSWLATAPATQCIVTCCLHQGYWTPIVWNDKVSHLEVLLWDHESVDLSFLEPLHQLLCQGLKLPTYQVVASSRNFAQTNLWGAAAFAFVSAHVGLCQLPRNDSHLQAFHDECRIAFRHCLLAQNAVCRPWCWGAGSFDLPSALATLLTQHGVPG